MFIQPVIMTRLITPVYLNSDAKLFGGQLMKWMDEAAFIAATRYTREKMVTVSVDNIIFKKPVPAGSILEIKADVQETDGVKLRIHVKAFVESVSDNTQTITAESWFSFACTDEHDHPKRIKKSAQPDP